LPQENQLVQVLEKNTELAIQNTDLQKQVQKLQHHEPGKSANPTALTSTTTMHESDRLDSILRVSSFLLKKNNTQLSGNEKKKQ
jgi:regulator of replication initiation timing